MYLSNNVIELLTRVAKRSSIQYSQLQLPQECTPVLRMVEEFRSSLKREDVLQAAKARYPDYFNLTESNDIDDEALLEVLRNEQHKFLAEVVNQKITQAILQNDQTFKWDVLLHEVMGQLQRVDTRNRKHISSRDLNWEQDTYVASLGYSILDTLIGGLAKSDFVVGYAASNMGKSTVFTRHIAAHYLKQGKTPLVISLEGDPQYTTKKILANVAGIGKADFRDFTSEEYDMLRRTAEEVPPFTVINTPNDVDKAWKLERLCRGNKPDIVIFDQLTISGSREWQQITNLCMELKHFSLNSGIPVFALTQSDEMNYVELQGKGSEESKGMGKIKYAAGIFEDANLVIYAKQVWGHPNQRELVIQKCKNDTVMSLLPVKVLVEWTDTGMKELGVTIQDQKLTVSEFMFKYSRKAKTAVEVATPKISIKTERGRFSIRGVKDE